MEKYIDELVNFKFISNWTEALNEDFLKQYMQERGLTLKTIRDFDIGYDVKEDKITIPIFDEDGNIVNIRKYKKGIPTMPYEIGYGENKLFPIKNIFNNEKNIVICEGEHDTMLMCQEGFNAITTTAGAGSWNINWNNYFNKKIVYLVYDCDKAGRNGAKRVSELLAGFAEEIYIVDLQLDDKEDITDFFVKYKKTNADLFKIFSKIEPIDSYLKTNLVDAIDSKNCGKKIKFPGIIIGKDLSPYQVPKIITLTCNDEKKDKKYCNICGLNQTNKETIKKELTFEKHKEILINFILKSDTQVMGLLRNVFNIPAYQYCHDCKLKIIERQNIEDISIVPEITYDDENENKYALHRALYFGSDIQTNQSYLFKGTTLPDPNTQMGLYAIKEIKGTKDIISKFELTDKHRKDLKIFQPEEKTRYGVRDKIDEICNDLSTNVTKILKRDELIIATNLVYHSVLNFYFCNKYIHKGWLELAIVGDTGIGKTETVKALTRHFQAGEFITSGENATKAGLIGGLQQVSNTRWTVTWGKLVLNDKGACIIDEMDDLAKKDLIGHFSGIRSSGVAELVKIQTQKTTARTRLIWIANPLNQGKMSNYNYGIEAIKEIFKTQQDVRRIDFAIICTKEQVPFSMINTWQKKSVKHIYNNDIYHTSVLRAWNIKAKNIIFEANTENKILHLATKFGEKYSSDIPLILGSDVSIKIARLCVSLATWMYSTSNGDDVIVYPYHIDYIEKFIESIYDTPTLGYLAYSNHRYRLLSLKNTDTLDSLVKSLDEIDELLQNSTFTMSDFEELFNCTDRQATKRIISELKHCGALYKANTYYQKTPAFINYLVTKRKKLETEDAIMAKIPY